MKLNTYMDHGIQRILAAASAFYLTNAGGRRFLARFLPEAKRAAARRKERTAAGLPAPPFLIASIASQCNLHCAGCYARAEGLCADDASRKELLPEEWDQVFQQAEALGVSFILLAGGEPLLKREVLEVAARRNTMVFPVFTNGLLLQGSCLTLFQEHRNLIPVLSMEGDAEQTDLRRGSGVAQRVDEVMKILQEQKLLFAVSITVTRENLEQVTRESFVDTLHQKGCGVVFYVEYVPVQPETVYLALTEEENRWLTQQVAMLKRRTKGLAVLSFPGDEEKMGGCLAAGRGFFHISPTGAAEPCPFSPHAHQNVREDGLEAVLESEFFRQVREISGEDATHLGGCTLYHHEGEVAAL